MKEAPIVAITARTGPSFSCTESATISAVYMPRLGLGIAMRGHGKLASVGNHRDCGRVRYGQWVALPFRAALSPCVAHHGEAQPEREIGCPRIAAARSVDAVG